MDRYEEELRKAIEFASPIQAKFYHLFDAFRFIGATEGSSSRIYYYMNPLTGEYCYETDFGREMRLNIRRNRLKNYTKK